MLAPQGQASRIVFDHLAEHLDPLLMYDVAEMTRHVARSMFLFDHTRLGSPAVWDCWVERVPPEQMPPLATFTLRRGVCDGREFYEFRCRADMISQELADELNEEIYPSVHGALLPRWVTVKGPKGLMVPGSSKILTSRSA